ncbi:MAG: TA system VapC family ribonuclease toxin [Candidatus Competibacter denitrificans]
MKIVDLNVLLYVVNADSAHHRPLLEWWNQAVNQESLGLPWVVLLGFLRISTHPKIFPSPLAPEIALRTVDTWLSLDNIRVVREREQHWEILRSLLEESGTAGNLTTDAHAVLISCDNDFMRFKGLRWENPLGHLRR